MGTKDVIVKIAPKYTDQGPEAWRGVVPEGSICRVISTLAVDSGFSSTATVMVLESPERSAEGTELTIPIEYLAPIPPKEGDPGYVLTGEYKGRHVRVQHVEDDEAYVEVSPGLYPQIPINAIAKVYVE